MKVMKGKRGGGRRRKTNRLAKVNKRIAALSSELEILHYMRDRLEKEIEEVSRPIGREVVKKGGNKDER